MSSPIGGPGWAAAAETRLSGRDELYQQLRRLCRGRGLQRAELEPFLGAELAVVFGVAGIANTAQLRHDLTARINRLLTDAPPEVALAVRVALGVERQGYFPRLEERLHWLAGSWYCSTRTVRRRVDNGFVWLADKLDRQRSVLGNRSGYLQQVADIAPWRPLDGPAKDLRDAVYSLYAGAHRPQLAELAQQIAGDDRLPGVPSKDLIGKIISGDGLAAQQDTMTVAVALARIAGREDTPLIAEQVRQLWIAAATAGSPPSAERLGRPVGECDPLVLEVHRTIQVPETGASADPLPLYVSREHDSRLRTVADQVLDGGSSRLVTLVGGSSTGKTRACWELARYLDQRQPGQWWVWHPYDPTRPQAAVADLERVGACTVVWLNEAQHYLMPADPVLGERLAAGLRSLLDDADRAPVLVLATLWPQYWDTLTVRPGAGEPDPYAQARDLLAGTGVPVADTFTLSQVTALAAEGADARLRYAAEHAEDGRITQYLAGAPELESRYRTAGPAARALIQVAMDARRLGHPLPIPHAILEQAAPGYLDSHDWDNAGEDWLEHALADNARPAKGARGPLTRIRSRPGQNIPDGGPYYRLADYLEQIGRNERRGVYPPDSLWQAFASTVTDPDLLRTLGIQAEERGRYQHAIWLYRKAADRGQTRALWELARLRRQAGDAAGAEALYRQVVDRGDIAGLWELARLRKQARDAAGVETPYRHLLDGGDLTALWELADRREHAGDAAGAEALALQAADRGDIAALWELAYRREQAGDAAGAEALALQAAARGETGALRALARLREQAGDAGGAEALAVQAADRGETAALRELARLREQAGDAADAEALYRQVVDRGDIAGLWELARLREQAGDAGGAEALAVQAADRGDNGALWELARLREQAGDAAGAEALAVQAADRGGTGALWDLADRREQAGDVAGAAALAVQAADRGDTRALRDLANRRRQAGDAAGAEALYRQAGALYELAWLREQAGDAAGAEALYRQAADRGDTGALRALARLREHAGDVAGAEALAVQAADRGETGALWELVGRREQAGDAAGAEALAVQAADRGNIGALRDLTRLREQAGDAAGAEALYRQAADRGDTGALRVLARLREHAGDAAGAEALAVQAANRGETGALWELAGRRKRAGDAVGAEALYRQAADRGDTGALWELARLREQAGDAAGAEALAVQAANRGDARALRELAGRREEAGDAAGAEALAVQAANRGKTGALRALARLREQAGDAAGAEALAVQAANRGDTGALRALARLREQAGDAAGAEALAVQAANRGNTRALRELARLREQAGDAAGAAHIRRFGLTGPGEIATALDFESPVAGLSG